MNQISAQFNPKILESEIYTEWERLGLFTANPSSNKPPFCIVIPPPNVTGVLHMGHALNNSLQDVLCRFKRMDGYEVLWVPGTDHAGIATQNVVERALAKEGIKREDLGREKFLEKVWSWKEQYGGTIISQLKRMGFSCDWSRTRFTMDEGLSRAVREIFVQLYNDKLIYRGEYIVNWCTRCISAISDLEVVHHDSKGKLYHVRYNLADDTGAIVIATTRPETILADTAVAVNPKDPRYTSFVGKKVIVPLVGREVPVIADEYVDMTFGSGGLKVTPAHDPNDFEISRRHDIEVITMMDETGKILKDIPVYGGLDRFECRKRFVADLEAAGLLVKIEEHDNKIGKCQRCDTVIEPRVSMQWFVKAKSLAEKSIEAVKDGSTKIIPEAWEKTYFNWMDNIRDWCISRQLWWGHQIPVYYCADCGDQFASVDEPSACKCGSKKFKQDEDVLDTWFSSALWPFSTLGWPDKTEDLKKFYPTTVLVTGFDILFFWVARMMMFGIYTMKQVPFKDVYLHALLRDEHGQKMSKSKGNVLDPLDLVEKYGADAIRLTLTIMSVAGRDILLSEKRIEGYRNFMNKIWNATRFAAMNLDGKADKLDEDSLGLSDKWIRSRLGEAIRKSREGYENYQFNEIGEAVYRFFWDEFCAWYVEFCKEQFKGPNGSNVKQNMLEVLKDALIIMHPVVPFVTEGAWKMLPGCDGALMLQSFPSALKYKQDKSAEADMAIVQQVIEGVRIVRAELNISPKVELDIILSSEAPEIIKTENQMICSVARLSSIQIGARPLGSVVKVLSGFELYVVISGHIDLDAEKIKLNKELTKVNEDLSKLKIRLDNPEFTSRAKPHVIEGERVRLLSLEETVSRLSAALANLQNMK